MIYKPLTYYTNSPVSRGGSKGGSEIFAPPPSVPPQKKVQDKAVTRHQNRKLALR